MVANSPQILSSLALIFLALPRHPYIQIPPSKWSFQPIFKAIQSVLRSFRRLPSMLSATPILRTSLALLSAASLAISSTIPTLNGLAATGDIFRSSKCYCVEPQTMHTLERRYTHIFQLDYYNWHISKTFEAYIKCDSNEAILINEGAVHRDWRSIDV